MAVPEELELPPPLQEEQMTCEMGVETHLGSTAEQGDAECDLHRQVLLRQRVGVAWKKP